jgi:hypothetical protein
MAITGHNRSLSPPILSMTDRYPTEVGYGSPGEATVLVNPCYKPPPVKPVPVAPTS